jgi:hypothetical protein
MTHSYDRTEEERDRQRNNENGEYYPTPKQDADPVTGINQEIYPVGDIYDLTDELDGFKFPLD